MNASNPVLAAPAALVVALATLACGQRVQGKDPEPAPTAVPAAAEAAPVQRPAPRAEPAALPAATVLASQEYSGDPDLRSDVLEVRRVSGGALLLKWRLTHVSAPAATGLVAEKPKTIYHNWSWEGTYVTDPAENKKYMGLRDSNGAWIGQGADKWYGPGDRQVMWMKFPAPPETSTRITFVFPGFPPFEDLTVAP